MARLANVSGKEAAKAFANAGWQSLGQVGSHLVPQDNELSIGTL